MRSNTFPNRRPILYADGRDLQEPDVSIEIAEGAMGFTTQAMRRLEGILRAQAPRCIGQVETTESAHRYAGRVEFAQQLLAEFFSNTKGE